MRKRDTGNKILRYSIKKYSVGALSVVVGAFIFFGTSAQAAEQNNDGKETPTISLEKKAEKESESSEEKNIEKESESTKEAAKEDKSAVEIDKKAIGVEEPKTAEGKNENKTPISRQLEENSDLTEKMKTSETSNTEVENHEERLVDEVRTKSEAIGENHLKSEEHSTASATPNIQPRSAISENYTAENSSGITENRSMDRSSGITENRAATAADRASNSATEVASTTDRASNDEGIKKIPLTEEIAEKIKAGLIRLEGNKVDPSLIESDVLINNENGESNIEKDNDGDKLLTNKELYVYEKDGKQYVGYNSHPYLKDTDGDGITDDKEKEGEVLKWNVSDRDLAMFQELAYRDDSYINEVLDETRKEIKPYEGRNEYYMMNKELAPYWKVKRTYHDNNGFDAVLFETKSKFPYLKDGAAQVLAIRGTEGIGGDTTADLALWFGKKPKQAGTIEKIIKNYALGEENLTNLYITGHSLGGYLTQIAFTHAYQLMKDKKGTSTEEQAKFDNFYNNVLKRAVTFNAPRICTNKLESQEFWDKGLYSTELAKAGKIKHYVVDNDNIVGSYYNDKTISIGKSAEGHGSRSYFEERVNALGYFNVGERNTMNGTGYRDIKVSETTPIEVENPIDILAGGKLSDATLKQKLKLNAKDILKLGDLNNVADFSTNKYGTFVMPLIVTHEDGKAEKKYVEISVSPNWFFFDNELNASKNKLKEQVNTKHKTQTTLNDYNAAKLSLEEEVKRLDSFRTNFKETTNTQEQINTKKKEIAELLTKYKAAINSLVDVEKYKLEIIKVQGGKIPENEAAVNDVVATLITETKLENPTSEVLAKLAENEQNKNLVLLDKVLNYVDEEADDAIYHVGKIYVSEVGKLIVHNANNEVIQTPFTLDDERKTASYKVPKADKNSYYSASEDSTEELESEKVITLTGEERFKDVNLFWHKYVARDLYVMNEPVNIEEISKDDRGDGTLKSPYKGLSFALDNARDGDILHFVTNVVITDETGERKIKNPDVIVASAGNNTPSEHSLIVLSEPDAKKNAINRRFYEIGKNVTIDGAGHEMIIRGLDLEMGADVTLKNMNISMLLDGRPTWTRDPQPRISANDHTVVFENVTTISSQSQSGDRPILVAGRAEGELGTGRRETYTPKESYYGTGANITIRNTSNQSTTSLSNEDKLKNWAVFENIIVGNGDGSEKTTPTTLNIAKEVMSLKGVDLKNVVGPMNIETRSNDIKAYLHGEKNSANSVIVFGGEDVLDNNQFDNILIDKVKNIKVINSGLSLDKNSIIQLDKLEVTNKNSADIDFGEVANKMSIKDLNISDKATLIIPLEKEVLNVGRDNSEKLKLRFNMSSATEANYGDTIVHVEEGTLKYNEDPQTKKMMAELITEKESGVGHDYILGVEKKIPIDFYTDSGEKQFTVEDVKYIDDDFANYTDAVAKAYAENEKLRNYVIVENSNGTLIEEVYNKDDSGGEKLYPDSLKIILKKPGKLIVHDAEDGGTKEIPYTIKVVDNKQVVSYEVPQSKYAYYTDDAGKVLSSEELSGEARFKNIDIYPKYRGVKLRFKLTDNDNTVKYLLKDIDAKYKSDDVNDYFEAVKDEIVTDRAAFDDYVLVDYKDNKLGGDIKNYEAVEHELTDDELNSLNSTDYGKMFITINLHKVGNLHIRTNGVDKVSPYLAINNEKVPRVIYSLPRDNNVVYFITENGTRKVVEAGKDVYLEGDARIRDTYIDAVEKTTRYFIEGTTTEIRTSEKGEKKPYLTAVNYNDEVYYYSKTEPMDENGVTTQYFKKAGSVSIHFISTTGEELDEIVGKDENYVLRDVKAGTPYDFANNENHHPDTLEAVPRKFKRVTEAGTITTKDGKVLSYNEHGNITSDGYAPDAGEVASGENLIITYVYKEEVGGITVGYYTADGKPLSGIATGINNKNEVAEKEVVVMNGKEIKDVPYGTPYDATLLRATTITTKDGDKYYYVRKESPVDEKGDISKEGNFEVKYYYEKGGSVVINYISTTGEKLKDEQIGQDSKGDIRDVKPGTAYDFENDEHMRPENLNLGKRAFRLVKKAGTVSRDEKLTYNDKGYVTSDGYAPEAGTIQSGKTLNITYVYKELLGGIKVAYYDASNRDDISGTTTGIEKKEVKHVEVVVENVSMGTPYDATKLRAKTITTKKGDKYYYLKTIGEEEKGEIAIDEDFEVSYLYEKGGSVVVNYISKDGKNLLPEKIVVNSKGEKLEKVRSGAQYDVTTATYKIPTLVANGKLYKLVEGEAANGVTTPAPFSDIEKLRYENGVVTKTDTLISERKGRKYAKTTGQVESGKTLDITYVYEEVPVPEPKVVTEKIPFTTIYIADPEKDYGVDSETEGVDGEKVTTTTYTLDEKTATIVEKVTESTTLMQPKIVRKGTKTKVEKVTSDVEVKYVADENVEADKRTSQQGRAKVTTTTTTYTLNPTDGTVTSKEEKVVEDGTPTIITVGTKAKEERTTLPTIYKADDQKDYGSEDDVQEGEDKVVTTTYKLDETSGVITPTTATTKEGKAKVVTKGTKAKVETIALPTIYKADDNKEVGTPDVVEEGEDKVVTTTYKLDKATGKVTPETTTKEGRAKVVTKGTKPKEERTTLATIYKADDQKDYGSQDDVQDGEDKVVTTTYKLDKATGKVTPETTTKEGKAKVVTKGTKTKEERTTLSTVYKADDNKEVGTPDVVEEGEDKVVTTTYKLDETSGVITPTTATTKEGRAKVVTKGTKPKEERTTLATIYKADDQKDYGSQDVVEEGEDKVVTTTYKLDTATGKVTSTTTTKEGKAKVVTKGTKAKVETIALPTIYKADDQKDYGSQDDVQEGEDKVVTTTYKLDTATGKVTPETTTKEGKAKVVTKGTKAKVETTPYTTQYIADPTKDVTSEVVVQNGKDKVVITAYKLDTTNGKVSEEISTIDGEDRIVIKGTKSKIDVVTSPVEEKYIADATADLNSRRTIKSGTAKVTATITTYTLDVKTGEVTPSTSTKVTEGTVEEIAIGTKPKVEKVNVDFGTNYVADETLNYGETKEVAGELGEKEVTTTYKLVGDKAVVDTTTEKQTKAPVAKVVTKGTKPKVVTEELDFTTEYIENPEVEAGVQEEKIAGQKGSKVTTTTYTLDPTNGTVTANKPTEKTTPAKNRVVKVGTKEKVEKEKIPFKVRYEVDSRLKFGEKISTLGKDGEKVTITTYKVDPKTGELSTTPTTTITEAQDVVVSIGNIEKTEEDIPVTITYIEDKTLLRGESSTTEGKAGRKELIKTYKLDNKGNLIEPTPTEKILIAMKPTIVRYGTKVEVAPSEEALPEYPIDKVPTYHEKGEALIQPELPEGRPFDKGEALVQPELPEGRPFDKGEALVQPELPKFKWEIPSRSSSAIEIEEKEESQQNFEKEGVVRERRESKQKEILPKTRANATATASIPLLLLILAARKEKRRKE